MQIHVMLAQLLCTAVQASRISHRTVYFVAGMCFFNFNFHFTCFFLFNLGVGRTGTYIVLDAMLKQIEHKGVLNVFGFLRHIRNQRNFLVQTEEQYIFIHDALVEAINSGETNIKADMIMEIKDNYNLLAAHFKLITQFQAKDVHTASAMKPVNVCKNRSSLLPLEGSRVHLTPRPGEDGSDYINATWLQGKWNKHI